MVRLKRLSMFLVVTSFISLSQCQATLRRDLQTNQRSRDGPIRGRERRDLSQLEQVVKVLEAQGRLHEVDSGLLERINTALGRDSSEAAEQVFRTGYQDSGEVGGGSERRSRSQAPPTPVSAKQSFLERARQRQLALLGSRETGRRKESGIRSQEIVRRKEQCRDQELDMQVLTDIPSSSQE